MARKSAFNKNYYQRLIKRYFDLLLSKKLDPLLDCFAKEAVMFFPAAGIRAKGRAAVRRVFEQFVAEYPTHRVTVKHVAVDGNFGTTEQRVILVDHSGRKSEFPDNANHFRFLNGKIARVRIYSDYVEGQPLAQEFKTPSERGK